MDEKACEFYLKRKQRTIFLFTSSVLKRVTKTLDVIHSNIFGPFEVPSLRGESILLYFFYRYIYYNVMALHHEAQKWIIVNLDWEREWKINQD